MTDPRAASPVAHAEVRLWGRTVGAVAELDDGRIVFEYADEFRRSGLEISPVHLPLSLAGPQSFPELQRSPAFRGLPGVLADALPDAFGNKVIRAYFAARGEEGRALSPVQRLLYVGERALGALTFHPPERLPPSTAELESLAIAELVREARKIVEGDPAIAIPEIYRIGSSAGGMRPKAVIRYHPESEIIRSGYAAPIAGDVAMILKFDGVGDGATAERLGIPLAFNRIEAAYGKMARKAGLDTTHITVLETGGYAHLLIERFDIESGRRLHQHTLGGLLHIDYNDPGASSYEEFLRTILRLGMPQAAVIEGFRRMAFNVLAVNQDDHVKNLSFHLRPDGRWRLAPAYDLTFAHGSGFTARHQMRVRDKTSGITEADLLAVAETFDIRKPKRILDRIREALAAWPEVAREFGVPARSLEAVGKELSEAVTGGNGR